MSQKSRAVLKTKFESGRTPTEKDFSDTLDSGINKTDDQISTRPIEGSSPAVYVGIGATDPDSPISVKNRSGAANLIGFQDENDDEWQIEINPEGGARGLNIQEYEKEGSNLFIQSEGNVGIGTKTPEKKLTVEGTVRAEEFEGEVKWQNISDVPVTSLVPAGAIIMWSGAVEAIPNGWILCDGENDSPDLRDRFIIGAGSTFNSNDLGEPDKHNHDLSIPDQTLTTSTNGHHSHQLPSNWYRRNFDDGRYTGIDIGGGTANFQTTQGAGGHNHTVSFSSLQVSSSESDGDNKPRWYSLCFIMKTPE